MTQLNSSSRLQSVRSLIESRRWLVVLAVLGTLLRFALIALTPKEHFLDEVVYDYIGVSLSHGLGFKDIGFLAYRAPGQPAFIGLIFTLFGHRPIVVEIVGAILLASLPFLCSRIGLSLGLGPLAANLGATLAAFHPGLTYASTTLYPTVLTTVALTLGIWLCWESLERNRAVWAIAAGLALGVAGAATTTFAPFAFLAAVIIAFKRRLKMAALVAVVGLAPALAWMIRNEIVLHDFVLSTNGGYNLEIGANDQATPRSGNWVDPPLDWTVGEVRFDHNLRNQAMAWIRAHPGRYAELSVLRALAVFDSVGRPRTQGLHSGRLAHIAGYALLPVVLLGAAGLILYRWHPVAWLAAAALALVVFSSALTLAKPRFRFPVDPLLCVFAVGTVVSIRRPQAGTK